MIINYNENEIYFGDYEIQNYKREKFVLLFYETMKFDVIDSDDLRVNSTDSSLNYYSELDLLFTDIDRKENITYHYRVKRNIEIGLMIPYTIKGLDFRISIPDYFINILKGGNIELNLKETCHQSVFDVLNNERKSLRIPFEKWIEMGGTQAAAIKK
ncbi:MAG: hypothetical protein ACPGSD_09130 [Flavobacteriales bacterium]